VLENRELGQLDFAGPLLGNRRCVRASINEKPQISIRNQDDDQGPGSYRVSVTATSPSLPMRRSSEAYVYQHPWNYTVVDTTPRSGAQPYQLRECANSSLQAVRDVQLTTVKVFG